MATTVSQMTRSELKEMIEEIIEQKLLELVGDPDEGLPIKSWSVVGSCARNRLLQRVNGANRLKMWYDDLA